jgi:hypothetical protein
MISRNIIFVLMYHRHKHFDLTNKTVLISMPRLKKLNAYS